MRAAAFALLLSVAACSSLEPAVEPTALAASETAAKKETQVCWTEIVTGTRARRQTVCRTERSERNGEQLRDDLKDFQDRSGASGPPTIMGDG